MPAINRTASRNTGDPGELFCRGHMFMATTTGSLRVVVVVMPVVVVMVMVQIMRALYRLRCAQAPSPAPCQPEAYSRDRAIADRGHKCLLPPLQTLSRPAQRQYSSINQHNRHDSLRKAGKHRDHRQEQNRTRRATP